MDTRYKTYLIGPLRPAQPSPVSNKVLVWKHHVDQMPQTQIERLERSADVKETFLRSSHIKQIVDFQPISVTSDDVQPLTSQWKITMTAKTEPNGELGKNATAQTTTTSKPTPQDQLRYPTRQCKTP